MAKKKVEALDAEVTTDDFIPETQPIMVVNESIRRTGLSSDELRKRILELVGNIRENYLELAQCLWETFEQQKNTSWGYSSFKEYAQKELGVKYGKANYLKNIWMHFGKDEELLDQVKSVGWDKMKELTKIVTQENVKEWVDKANLLSCDDLKKEVKSHLKNLVPNDSQGMMDMEGEVRGTPVETQLHSQTFQFSYDSKGTVLSALEKVQKETGSSASEALALICADYIGSADEGTGTDAVLTMVRKYESLLGLRFVVLDPASNQLLHGKDTLETLVRTALA